MYGVHTNKGGSQSSQVIISRSMGNTQHRRLVTSLSYSRHNDANISCIPHSSSLTDIHSEQVLPASLGFSGEQTTCVPSYHRILPYFIIRWNIIFARKWNLIDYYLFGCWMSSLWLRYRYSIHSRDYSA